MRSFRYKVKIDLFKQTSVSFKFLVFLFYYIKQNYYIYQNNLKGMRSYNLLFGLKIYVKYKERGLQGLLKL